MNRVHWGELEYEEEEEEEVGVTVFVACMGIISHFVVCFIWLPLLIDGLTDRPTQTSPTHHTPPQEEEEEEEESGAEEGEVDGTGLETPMTDKTGLSSVVSGAWEHLNDGVALSLCRCGLWICMAHRLDSPPSLECNPISGLETPEGIDLRKKAGLETPLEGPQALYKKLEQTDAGAAGGGGGGGFFAGEKRYAGLGGASSRDVQIALNPDELVDSLRDENALKVGGGVAWVGLCVGEGTGCDGGWRRLTYIIQKPPQEKYEQELEARQQARRLDDSDDEDEGRGKKRKADKGGGRSTKKSKDQFKF